MNGTDEIEVVNKYLKKKKNLNNDCHQGTTDEKVL